MKTIARVRSDFKSKFGIPRQSNLVPELVAYIVFEPEYQNPDAIRGLEEYSHLWLIWEFSENVGADWSPTVRPPRLGGNTRMGVFATRSPFRPNPIGLSSVKLEEIISTRENGMVLKISGADLLNGTPIYDIKPYIPYSDTHADAKGGFAADHMDDKLKVVIPEEYEKLIAKEKLSALRKVLELDPRPSYHTDEQRVYGMSFAEYEVRFRVERQVLNVTEITEQGKEL
ncbi:MAG: tRNA (N6-threonylcarbamoyladenosine(37)-N6)-methyltransferase TrmO [Hespellia sp.]|nr:tRNA (N6-threonylcarbamoyladenosine(37)-N6)-methyltransferase TrmO [Hespellia sp.]